ncbi:MAG: RluA family pseudouridine synthase [Holdemanella sp.]|nr:RluA family pseudouridine synthase [Holdemanella sp.]
MKQIDIQSNDANQRVDKFLMKTFPNLSKSMMYKAIRNKKIKVNRKRCTYDQMLVEGDSILLFLPEEFLEMKSVSIQDNHELDIIYEDENVLIVNKPYGLLSQSDTKDEQDCLVSRIQSYLYHSHQYDPAKEHSFTPAICHRLDRNTTGLVIAAKNANALKVINEAISNRKIHKYYKAMIQGVLPQKEMEITVYIKKEDTKALVSLFEEEGYKKATLKVKELYKKDKNSCVEVELMTGRFHQIRATLGFLNHPLLGDVKYGYKGNVKQINLQAYKLIFDDINIPIQKIIEIE